MSWCDLALYYTTRVSGTRPTSFEISASTKRAKLGSTQSPCPRVALARVDWTESFDIASGSSFVLTSLGADMSVW
jgi:hypothetical protein